MQTYLVGGAVRDAMLGLAVGERDWVVVGADPAAMRAAGFVPADASFPVFLHPSSGEEYALARRETKSGEGYRGFVVEHGADVTLEEDLRRRDLTVNAIARAEDGTLVDPYGGRDDLDARLLRHVSPAFAEDPVRVLRVARFAAKLGHLGFRVAHATHRLMGEMVARGDMAHLTAERLWREMDKAMRTEQPWRFFEVLHRCGALRELIPPLAEAMGPVGGHRDAVDPAPMRALRRIAVRVAEAAPRLAATLCGVVASTAAADALMQRLTADRVTTQLLHRCVAAAAVCAPAGRGELPALLELGRLWRAFEGHAQVDPLVEVCAARSDDPLVGRRLQVAFAAARGVGAAALAAQGLTGAALGAALAERRANAMRAALDDAGLVT